jgi:hypothetical protein
MQWKSEPLTNDDLAAIWYDAWQDAHAQILPAELKRFRTLESFRDRLRAALPDVRVVGPPGGSPPGHAAGACLQFWNGVA